MYKVPSFKEKQKTVFIRQKALRDNATPAELCLKAKLEEAGYRYIFQKGFIEGPDYVIVDFYIPKGRVCIEVDGGYHDTPKQKKRDYYKTKYITEYRGFRLIRMTNDQAFKISVKSLINKIKNIRKK